VVAPGFRTSEQKDILLKAGERTGVSITLTIGDVGQLQWEEVDRAPAGGLDFGWSRYEGPALFNASCALTLPDTTTEEFTTAADATIIYDKKK
jgi:hypothetical protein